MKRLLFAVAALSIGSAPLNLASAEEHGEHVEHGRPAEHGKPTERTEAPRFQGHPPGVHPRGATVHPHATRVLRPTVIVRGSHPWVHWGHPEFVRPVYYWEWGTVHSVSCIAEDSYGDQYPITQSAWAGFGMNGMSEIEDAALDRCYAESGQDPSCYLATCSHF